MDLIINIFIREAFFDNLQFLLEYIILRLFTTYIFMFKNCEYKSYYLHE